MAEEAQATEPFPPRLDEPVRYVVLGGDRMTHSPNTWPGHLESAIQDAIRRTGSALVFPMVHVDCATCHDRRKTWKTSESLAEAKAREAYWCNHCQGTGWVPEPWNDVYARYDVLTWEMVAETLSPIALQGALQDTRPILTPGEHRMPPDVVMKEAARRLAGGVVVNLEAV